MHMQKDERSLGDLFRDFASELSQLVRQEVRLAKTEVTQSAKSVGRDVGFMAAGGFIAYGGLLAIIAGFVALLSLALPLWLAAIIVGIAVALIGYALLHEGMAKLQKTNIAPTETIETLKEDSTWAHNQIQ